MGHQMLHQTLEVGSAQQNAVLSSLIHMVEDQRSDLWGQASVTRSWVCPSTTHPSQCGCR